jgi:diaminopimelate dehydrogenase
MIKIGIYGYGNLGHGTELAIKKNPDMELVGIFSRRDPATVKTVFPESRVFAASDVQNYKNEIDVLILCGGSAKDLPLHSPALCKHFNIVDSFDNHAEIPKHFSAVDTVAMANGRVAIISAGWDPGLFSLMRLLGGAILPDGKDYTFWGRGVSQGHSDAVRRIDGVLDARQYTVPNENLIEQIRCGGAPKCNTKSLHSRLCYVVAREGADREKIEREIKKMPNYFADYNTEVVFISSEEMTENHSDLPHGGLVIRSGKTGKNSENSHTLELKARLDSNPEFTASVLCACARAAYRLNQEKSFGAKTILDIPPAYLSNKTHGELLRNLM